MTDSDKTISPLRRRMIEDMTVRGLATSVGGSLTGRGGNLIIIDDPLKPGDAMSDIEREAVKQWFNGTLYSRLDEKAKDTIILT